MKFETLTLPQPLSKALQSMNFVEATPIQAQAIPPALEGKDLIGCAQTGTGKTGAFGIPLVLKLIQDPDATALILLPTRELAAQVCAVLQQLTQFLPSLTTIALTGGTSLIPQINQLFRSRYRIFVATPGRLIDHLRRGSVSLAKTRILVLDEADRMLDMGFAPQLETIMMRVPVERQSLLFSATLPDQIQKMASQFLRNPVRIQVGSASAAPKIEQQVLEISPRDKNDALLDEINARQGTVLVFTRTKRRTEQVARFLSSYGVSVAQIHGDRTQGQRNKALLGFREERYRVLVATDVAARGLDVDHIAHVINYDLPMSPEDYVHRVGRTGRNGREGKAVSFVTNEDYEMWNAIQDLQAGKKVSLPPRMGHSRGGHGGGNRSGGGGHGRGHAQARGHQAGPKSEGGGAAHPGGGGGGQRRRRRRR